jgi:hypothetical protein
MSRLWRLPAVAPERANVRNASPSPVSAPRIAPACSVWNLSTIFPWQVLVLVRFAQNLSAPSRIAHTIAPSAHGRFRRAPKLWNVRTSAGAALAASVRGEGRPNRSSLSKCCIRCVSRRPFAGTPHAGSAHESNGARIARGAWKPRGPASVGRCRRAEPAMGYGAKASGGSGARCADQLRVVYPGQTAEQTGRVKRASSCERARRGAWERLPSTARVTRPASHQGSTAIGQ